MSCSERQLSELAGKFRAAILACDMRKLFVTLQGFPSGACGDASYLLAKYLEQNGCGQFEYVVGERRTNFHSHAWLEQNGIIVDITTDQFEGMNNPILVTTDCLWHPQFEEEDRHIADFERYDQNTVNNLFSSYELVIEKLKHNQAIHLIA